MLSRAFWIVFAVVVIGFGDRFPWWAWLLIAPIALYAGFQMMAQQLQARRGIGVRAGMSAGERLRRRLRP